MLINKFIDALAVRTSNRVSEDKLYNLAVLQPALPCWQGTPGRRQHWFDERLAVDGHIERLGRVEIQYEVFEGLVSFCEKDQFC